MSYIVCCLLCYFIEGFFYSQCWQMVREHNQCISEGKNNLSNKIKTILVPLLYAHVAKENNTIHTVSATGLMALILC